MLADAGKRANGSGGGPPVPVARKRPRRRGWRRCQSGSTEERTTEVLAVTVGGVWPSAGRKTATKAAVVMGGLKM